jgi:hypothetical protein
VKPNAFVQSGHGIPLMSATQASSATAQPSTSGHTGMLRYSSTMSRVLYLHAKHHHKLVAFGAGGVLCI